MNSTITKNPYSAYIDELNSKLYLDASPTYLKQTYAISGILAILLILQLVSLVIRYRKGTFWVFKFVNTQAGSFILPNGVICWGISSSIFLTIIQGFYAAMRNYATPGSPLYGDMAWRTVIFIPLFLGLCCMTHGTLLAPIITAPIGSANPSFLARYPLLLNIFFISIPIVTIVSVVPLSVQLNNIFNRSFDNYLELHSLLVAASSAFENGITTPSDPARLLSLQSSLQQSLPQVIDAWSKVFVVWYVLLGFEILVFVVAAAIYFRSLGSAIRNLKSKNFEGETYVDEMKTLSSAFRSLVYSTTCVLCVAISYFIFNIILAVTAGKVVVRGGYLPELLVLGCGYIYTLFGGLAIGVTFYRSFKTATRTSAQSISLQDNVGGKSQASKTPKRSSKIFNSLGNRFIFSQSVQVETDDSYYGRKNPFEVEVTFDNAVTRTSSIRNRDEEREVMGEGKGPFM